jgi:2'-5' RNA ligase
MSGSGSARLFVAVDPPAGVRERLAGWARSAVGVGGVGGGPRLIGADALHLTLCFLGHRPVAEIEGIAKLALGCAMPVPELELGAPLWLPRRRPKVLAVAVRDPSGALEELQAAVGEALAAGAGYEPERRRFAPHVTVARMRAGSTAPGGLDATPALAFDAEALTLYRSWLSPAGARYEALATVALR